MIAYQIIHPDSATIVVCATLDALYSEIGEIMADVDAPATVTVPIQVIEISDEEWDALDKVDY